MSLIASLPMYDLPQEQAIVDTLWRTLRDVLRRNGINAPARLARCNADLPAVPGGIRDVSGVIIAPDPATLPSDEFDLHTLWHHPALLFAQTCWGPLQQGLEPFVDVLAQDSYDGISGGAGPFYRSALIQRRQDSASDSIPADTAVLPPLSGQRLAFNSKDSRSGYLALERDLRMTGASMTIFAHKIRTGSHLASLHMVASKQADIAAIDCRTWALAQKHHPFLTEKLQVSGWTTPSMGLPFICSVHLPSDIRAGVATVSQQFFLNPKRC